MFFDKFKMLCDDKHISVSAAAKEIGLSNSTPTKWKKTGATPDGSTLARIAIYFGVTTDSLLDKSVERIHYEDMDNLYHHSIIAWSQNQFFSEYEITNIEMHYAELLLRYKGMIEAFADCKMNINRVLQNNSTIGGKDGPVISQQQVIEDRLRNELEKSLDSLKEWIDVAPRYLSYAVDKTLALKEANDSKD